MTDDEAIQAAQKLSTAPAKSGDSSPSGMIEDLLSGVQLAPLMNTPVGKFALTMAKDPDFRQSATEIAQKFNKTTFLGYEFAWIIVIWVFRSWRLTKVNTLLTRLWTQAWVGMVFWWGALTLIPWVLWGKSYQTALASLIRGLIHQF
jgi:hypothetical protein